MKIKRWEIILPGKLMPWICYDFDVYIRMRCTNMAYLVV